MAKIKVTLVISMLMVGAWASALYVLNRFSLQALHAHLPTRLSAGLESATNVLKVEAFETLQRLTQLEKQPQLLAALDELPAQPGQNEGSALQKIRETMRPTL